MQQIRMSPQDNNDDKALLTERVANISSNFNNPNSIDPQQPQPQESPGQVVHGPAPIVESKTQRSRQANTATSSSIDGGNHHLKRSHQQVREDRQDIMGQKKATNYKVSDRNKVQKTEKKQAASAKQIKEEEGSGQLAGQSQDSYGSSGRDINQQKSKLLGGDTVAIQKPSGGTNAHANVPSFLVKTYEIVSDPKSNDIICWNDEGDGFVVKRVNEFSDKILPKYFKHSNFASFIRQLNMYDFHKTRNMSNQQCFQHSSFKRGNKEFLRNIKRKTSAAEKQRVLVDQILGGQISSMAGQLYSNKRIRRAMGKLTCPPDMTGNQTGPLMLTHHQALPQPVPGGRAPLMITQGHNEDRVAEIEAILPEQTQNQINELGSASNEYKDSIQLMNKKQIGGQTRALRDEIDHRDINKEFQMHPQNRLNDQVGDINLEENQMMTLGDMQGLPTNSVSHNNQIQRIVQTHNLRISQLENRLNHIEMLNKKYVQENFELHRANIELQKNKESHRMLEKFFFMLLNSVGAGNIAGNLANKFTLMPSITSQRKLEAPQQSRSSYPKRMVQQENDRQIRGQSSHDQNSQLSDRVANQKQSKNYYDFDYNNAIQLDYKAIKDNQTKKQSSKDTTPICTDRNAEISQQYNLSKNTKNIGRNLSIKNDNFGNEKKQSNVGENIPRIINDVSMEKTQQNNEESRHSRRSATSRRSKSEPRSYRRSNQRSSPRGNEDDEDNLKKKDFFVLDKTKQNSNSSKDKLVIMHNNGDRTSISKLEDIVNQSDYLVRRAASSLNQASIPNEHDNYYDEILSNGRQNSINYNPGRFYQPRRMFSGRHELFGQNGSMSGQQSSNHPGPQFQEMLRLMFEIMNQQQSHHSPKYNSNFNPNSFGHMGASPRASVGYGTFPPNHNRSGLGFSKNLSYKSGTHMTNENDFKINQMAEWFQDQMATWIRGKNKQNFITFNEDQFYDPERFATTFPKYIEKTNRQYSNTFINLKDTPKSRGEVVFEEPIGIPAQRSPPNRKSTRNYTQNQQQNMSSNYFEQNFDNLSNNNSMTMKNEFSSFTEILNREDSKPNPSTSNQKQEKNFSGTKGADQINLANNPNNNGKKQYLIDKYTQDNEQSMVSNKDIQEPKKRNIEDLSSIHPSPQISRVIDQPYIKQHLENIKEHQSNQIDQNLNFNKHEFSIASSLPDPIDASQILKEENSFKQNMLDSSQTNIGLVLQDSQINDHYLNKNAIIRNSSLLPTQNGRQNNNDQATEFANESSKKLDLRSREASEAEHASNLQQQNIRFPHSRYPPGYHRAHSQVGDSIDDSHHRLHHHRTRDEAYRRMRDDTISDKNRSIKPQSSHSRQKANKHGNSSYNNDNHEESIHGQRSHNNEQSHHHGSHHRQSSRHERSNFGDGLGNRSIKSHRQNQVFYNQSDQIDQKMHEQSAYSRRQEYIKRQYRDMDREQISINQNYANQDSFEVDFFNNFIRNAQLKDEYNNRRTGRPPTNQPQINSNSQLKHAFQTFLNQNPDILKGMGESLNQYKQRQFTEDIQIGDKYRFDNKNNEFETISNHSQHTKLLSKGAVVYQQSMMQSREPVYDGSMAQNSYNGNNRSIFVPNAQSPNEGSRISNSQSLQVRSTRGRQGPSRGFNNLNRSNGGGLEDQTQFEMTNRNNYSNHHQRHNPVQQQQNMLGNTRMEYSSHQNEHSGFRNQKINQQNEEQINLEQVNYPQNKKSKQVDAQSSRRFADPELDAQEIDRLMEIQNQRERLENYTKNQSHTIPIKNYEINNESPQNNPDYVYNQRYMPYQQPGGENGVPDPKDLFESQSQYLVNHLTKNQSLFNVSSTNMRQGSNLPTERLDSTGGGLRSTSKDLSQMIGGPKDNRGILSQNKNSDSSHRSMEKVD